MKNKQMIIILASIVCLFFLGCDAMATLFHGEKPEEPPVTYTVTFIANGATGTPPATMTVTSGTAINLPNKGTLSKGTDIFAGWKNQNEETIYPALSSITINENIIFFAQWLDGSTPQYTVIFDRNGATGGSSPSSQTTYIGMGIIIPNQGTLILNGKTFGGWNTHPNGGGTNYTSGSIYTGTENITLYAKWQSEIQYTVIYNANGASGTVPASQTVDPQTVITLPGQGSMTNTGKIFDGWNTQANGTGINYATETDYTVTGNITLYAKWQIKIEYTVTYYANGASGTVPTAHTVAPGTVITLPGQGNMIYSERPFLGWNTQANGEGTNYVAGAEYTVLRDVQFYAKWYSPTYTIVYDPNGGNGAMSNSIFIIGTSQNLRANAFTNTGYRFAGWSTTSNGAVEYTNQQSVTSLTHVDGATITLYAVWVEDATIVPGTTLNNKFTWLAGNAASNNAYIIEVNNDENIANISLSYSGKNNIVIKIRGIGEMKTINLSSKNTMFSIHYGVTLILDNNITLRGINDNSYSLIRVGTSTLGGGTFIMNANTIITGNTTTSEGGGVLVENYATFIMNGGAITGNTSTNTSYARSGGGVFVSDAIFTMNDGEISNNSSSSSGAGVYVMYGTFTMNGGEIFGNIITESSGSYDTGGGVKIDYSGKFFKNGGTIYGYTEENNMSNIVKNTSGVVQNNRGHGIYATGSIGTVRRESDTGPEMNLSFNGSSSGFWDGDWD